MTMDARSLKSSIKKAWRPRLFYLFKNENPDKRVDNDR
jgi:hypothetical protein